MMLLNGILLIVLSLMIGGLGAPLVLCFLLGFVGGSMAVCGAAEMGWL